MAVVLKRAQTAPPHFLEWHAGGSIRRTVLALGQAQGAVDFMVHLEPFPGVADVRVLDRLLALRHKLLIALLGLAGCLLCLGPGLAGMS